MGYAPAAPYPGYAGAADSRVICHGAAPNPGLAPNDALAFLMEGCPIGPKPTGGVLGYSVGSLRGGQYLGANTHFQKVEGSGEPVRPSAGAVLPRLLWQLLLVAAVIFAGDQSLCSRLRPANQDAAFEKGSGHVPAAWAGPRKDCDGYICSPQNGVLEDCKFSVG